MTKQVLRASIKERRSSIPPTGKKRLDALIRQRIAESKAFRAAKTVLLYAPLEGEIDLLPLISLCRRQGKAVGFPRCGKERTLTFHLLEDGQKLLKSGNGIPEPSADAPLCQLNSQTLCILPGLSFNRQGDRLGYGGGYYDRFLAEFPGVTVGAVYEKLMTEEIPTEPHDRAVELIVTERGCYACSTEKASVRWREAVAELLAPMRRTVKRMLHPEDTAAVSQKGEVRPLPMPPLLVAVTFLLLILSRVIDTALTRRDSEYVAAVLLQLLIFVVPTLVYLQLRGEAFGKRIRLTPMSPRHLWFCFCALAVMITSGLLLSIMTGGIRSLEGSFTLYDTFVARSDGSFAETVYVLLAYALLPAVCEEPIYRAVLCAEYESAGTGVAVTVSALFFAMLHFSIPLFPTYFALGLILAGVLYATRSTVATVLLHFFYNLFCLFGQPYLSAFYVRAGSSEIFLFCLITLMLLFAAFGAGEARRIYYLYAKANLSSDYTQPIRFSDYPRRILRVLSTPTVIPVVLIWLIMSILSLTKS